ncbi:MAG: hypothetical protein PVI30_06470 [Myxococcales bacterium]
MERALLDGDRGSDVIRNLEALAEVAHDGSGDALFAHRQLAELLLEQSPWRAALHLRRLLAAGAADDGVHALMGLSHALMGNFRAAVASYRRAIARAPRNPWYHHNLGHLLDVGLGEPQAASEHLHIAHELEPAEDEITASLAHCLARVGELEEAATLAARALRGSPASSEHRALLDWIESGAPSRDADRVAASRARAIAGRGVDDELDPALDGGLDRDLEAVGSEADSGSAQVARLITACMPEGGFSNEHVQRAQLLWTDFCGTRELRVSKPAVYAAAIEYAIAKLHSVRGVTQAALARRYGVAPGSISHRYGEIRQTLDLIPGDPRYSAGRR